MQCLCKSMSPVTVVDDLKGLFRDSKVEEVFSSEGVSALLKIQFQKMYIFYVLCAKSLAYVILVRYSWMKEKKLKRTVPSLS